MDKGLARAHTGYLIKMGTLRFAQPTQLGQAVVREEEVMHPWVNLYYLQGDLKLQGFQGIGCLYRDFPPKIPYSAFRLNFFHLRSPQGCLG
jgi:hypothetical protein